MKKSDFYWLNPFSPIPLTLSFTGHFWVIQCQITPDFRIFPGFQIQLRSLSGGSSHKIIPVSRLSHVTSPIQIFATYAFQVASKLTVFFRIKHTCASTPFTMKKNSKLKLTIIYQRKYKQI